jgi:hypothetical protein
LRELRHTGAVTLQQKVALPAGGAEFPFSPAHVVVHLEPVVPAPPPPEDRSVVEQAVQTPVEVRWPERRRRSVCIRPVTAHRRIRGAAGRGDVGTGFDPSTSIHADRLSREVG